MTKYGNLYQWMAVITRPIYATFWNAEKHRGATYINIGRGMIKFLVTKGLKIIT